ncbi:hypothetical protein DM02DRAFT_624159 [Periconia macrospinosa]|uniref:MYND-type domain-containing protein n=1 Tax=Periconia macrospinosa TaxID=97972 RepID=A0A2V1E890_9PLEO|nr:hypothetical protein DM02DRAFT_624159 [Periconia macrospinosa]
MSANNTPNGKDTDGKTSDDNANDKCTLCGKSNAKPCENCGNANYCGVVCKNADAALHKLLCHQYKDFQDRPSKHHVRCIVLPVDGSGPVFKWLHQEFATNPPDETKEILGEGNFGIKGKHLNEDEKIAPGTYPYPRVVQIFYRNDFFKADLELNVSAARFPGLHNPWKMFGPFLFLSYSDLLEEDFEVWDNVSNDDCMRKEDCDTTTLRHVQDLLNLLASLMP